MATNGLQPSLTPAEKAIVKSFGDWTNFMHSYGLKPFDFDDIAEAHAIVKAMAGADERQAANAAERPCR